MKEREEEPANMTRREATLVLLTFAGGALLALASSRFEKKSPQVTSTPTQNFLETETSMPPTKTAIPTPAPEATKTPEIPKTVEIILTGDVLLGRTVMTESFRVGDLAYPFREVGGVLNKGDIVFINLENPIIEKCPKLYEGLQFCADPKMVEGLKFAGVDVVNLANNHAGNYGSEGIESTRKILEEAGIEVTGLGNLVVKEKEGIKFGFLGFDLYSIKERHKSKNLTESEEETIKGLVRESKGKVDVLIVGVHWGEQYQKESNEFQKQWAKNFVENGADVVVGHHPHVIQETERINDKLVYYSLGNLVFDNMDPEYEATRRGLVMRLVYRNGILIEEEQLAAEIRSWAQPEFIEGSDK